MASKKVADSSHTTGKDLYAGRPQDDVTIKFEVPSRAVGLIVGSGGKQLKMIEEEAQLQKKSIHISNKNKSGVQTVYIKGHRSNCEHAKRKIDALVDLSKKAKPGSWKEVGHSSVAGRVGKHLSFLTFLKDTDEIVFRKYKGLPPVIWKDDDVYFLDACKRVSGMDVMHHHLRNYSWLQRSLCTAMDNCLRSVPVYLKLEARFGKVLWRSDSPRTVSDELLIGRHKIEDLESGGNVSVEDVLGGRGTRWVFQTILSDATILESVKDSGFPEIGDADRLDITMGYCRGSKSQDYLIRIEHSKDKKAFKVLEVLVKPAKPYVFDCLNLERDLDLRIGISCSYQNADTAAAAEINKIAEELCHGMTSRDGCLYFKEPPGCTVQYARKAKQTLYLITHMDGEHRECQYVLAHYEVKDCTLPQYSKPATRSSEAQLHFGNEHHEVELWNCQWMADFAVLAGKIPEEVFAHKCCDLSKKLKVRTKDKSKVNADSVIKELDPFVACALELAHIDRSQD